MADFKSHFLLYWHQCSRHKGFGFIEQDGGQSDVLSISLPVSALA